MPLSPEARSLLDMAYRVGAPKFHELSPAQARHSFQKLQFAFRPEAPAVASTTEVPMARADGSALLSRLYRPLSSSPRDVLPLLIYFHGGGWCVGDVASYDVLCRQFANVSGCAVLSVEYRLAPEHPFPAALEDAALAFDWAVQHAGLLGIDAGRIALGGDSAGGNLSIVTALSLRDAGIGPRFLLLIYPSTEILSKRLSRQNYGEGYFLDFGTLQWFFEHYLPDGNTEDWRASPMRAASLAGLPPVMLIAAEFDPLVDDCAAFAGRLREEGCEVDYLQVDGMVHGFITLGKLFPQANDAVRAAAGAVAAALRAG
ncbi:alpha/beta hydrolase [Thauera butanivorans]|uniref:alpha/beta hydrolase n=1 Tax=Thauera butanivorans TaxID=86174 RepID=UPI003AB36AD1